MPDARGLKKTQKSAPIKKSIFLKKTHLSELPHKNDLFHWVTTGKALSIGR